MNTEWVVNVIDGPPKDCGEISVLRNDNAHGKRSYGWFGDGQLAGAGRKMLVYDGNSSAIVPKVWKMQLALAKRLASQLNREEKELGFVADPAPPMFSLTDDPGFAEWQKKTDAAVLRVRALFPKLFEVIEEKRK